jgi:hypothetical protein
MVLHSVPQLCLPLCAQFGKELQQDLTARLTAKEQEVHELEALSSPATSPVRSGGGTSGTSSGAVPTGITPRGLKPKPQLVCDNADDDDSAAEGLVPPAFRHRMSSLRAQLRVHEAAAAEREASAAEVSQQWESVSELAAEARRMYDTVMRLLACSQDKVPAPDNAARLEGLAGDGTLKATSAQTDTMAT